MKQKNEQEISSLDKESLEFESLSLAQSSYIPPVTKMTEVEAEGGFCAASKEYVVTDDKNTKVTIDRQTEGGEFTISSWDN